MTHYLFGLLLLASLPTVPVRAQRTTPSVAVPVADYADLDAFSLPPNRFFATGYLGLATLTGAATQYGSTGFRGNTGIEYRVTPRFWITPSLNVDVYDFNRLDNGVTIKGQAALIELNVIASCVLLKKAKFQPYVAGGVGLAHLSIPVAQANYNTRQVTVNNQGAFFPAYQVGVGVQRAVFGKLTVFTEAYYKIIPGINYVGVPDIQQTSFHVGIKTPF